MSLVANALQQKRRTLDKSAFKRTQDHVDNLCAIDNDLQYKALIDEAIEEIKRGDFTSYDSLEAFKKDMESE